MPYLPINYYPKNTNLEIGTDDNNKLSFYCLIDDNDIITHAIIRVYDYLKKDLKLIIYMDKFGKKIQTIEMSDDIFLEWKNRTTNDNTSIWTDNENSLPIQGGLGDKSILYVEIDNDNDKNIGSNYLENSKKYFWTIEVFNENYDVFIVDGNLDSQISTATNTLKIYPNENIKAGQKIRLNYSEYNIKTIENNYFDFTTTGNCSKINNGYQIILNSNVVLPTNKNDLLIQVDVYTFASQGTDFDGTYTISDNKITITTSVQLQETNNIYVYIYRQYQTITINESIKADIDTYYSIYGDSIISSQNYFGTQGLQNLELKTNNLINNSVSDVLLSEIYLNSLFNMYHRFISNSNKYDIKWYQYIIKQNEKILYESDKIYKPYIDFSYNQFFDGNYSLQIKVEYKNGLLKTFNYPLNIQNEIKNDIKIIPFVDTERKAIGINYNSYISNYIPKGEIVDNEEYQFNILDGVIHNSYDGLYIKPKVTLNYNISDISFKNFEIKGRLNSNFSGDIIRFNNAGKLKYDGYDDEFSFPGFRQSEDISEYKSTLLTSPQSADQMNNQPESITIFTTQKESEEEKDITGLYDYDYMSKFDFVIELKDGEFSFKLQDGIGTTIILRNNFISSINNLALYGDIYWKKVNFYDENELSVFNLNFETSILNLNGGTLTSPNGYGDYSWLVFRNNYNKNNEVIYRKFIGEIIGNNSGIYDYSIGGDDKYDYMLVPIYKDGNNNFSSGIIIESEPIDTDWYEVSLFDTNFDNSNIKDSIYELSIGEKWYFELDADSGSITYNTETGKHSVGQKFPKITKTQTNYMSGSLSCKLGRIKDECAYINDNLEYLQKFIDFANNNNIKILRLKNGMVIPVEITLKSSNTNESLIGTPTDISFDWIQVGDHLKASLYELF